VLDSMVAGMVGIEIPFSAPITAPHAFHHKAGIHTKAVLGDPQTYEAFAPEPFGLRRGILVGHHLVGRHAVRQRAVALGIDRDDSWLRQVTTLLKERSEHRLLRDDEVDALLVAATQV
jgi:homocitrate synthase